MAECSIYKKTLQGSWKIAPPSTSYAKVSRDLGIPDAFLLNTELSSVVFCYFKSCWQKAILTYSFISTTQQVNTSQ